MNFMKRKMKEFDELKKEISDLDVELWYDRGSLGACENFFKEHKEELKEYQRVPRAQLMHQG